MRLWLLKRKFAMTAIILRILRIRIILRSRLKTYGDRAFSIARPKLWNDLPLEIRKCASVATFRQSLKTFLFKLAYRL